MNLWWYAVILIIIFVASGLVRFIIGTKRGFTRKNRPFNKHNTFAKTASDVTGEFKGTGFFGPQTKIWFQNSPKFVSINKYNYREIIYTFPFTSKFLVTKEQMNKRSVSLVKQQNIEKYLIDFNLFLKDTDQLLQNQLFQLFSLNGYPTRGTEQQWWNLYKHWLEIYRDLVFSYLYPNILTLLLDYGTQEDFTNKDLNYNYERLLNEFRNEAIYRGMHFGQEDQQQTNQQQNYYQYEAVNNELLDAYRTLELKENASVDDIKASYRRLAKKYHPDKNHTEQAKEKMLKINAAYALIKQERDF